MGEQTIAQRILTWFTSLNNILTQCNEKITGKSGNVATNLSGLPDAIDTITAGSNTDDATATASEILSPKTAYTAEGKVTGTMVNNGASNLVLDGIEENAVPIPQGYHSGGGVVSLNDNIKAEVSSQKTLIQEITAILDDKANAYPTITYDSDTGTLTITEVS